MTSARASNRNQPPNLHDLIAGKAEEVANMDRIALHDREESLLPSGKAFAESKIRRAGAMKRHEENHNMRVDVETWFAANRHRFKSVDAAAIEASTLIAPVTFRTAQSWIANWKRSVQSASKP